MALPYATVGQVEKIAKQIVEENKPEPSPVDGVKVHYLDNFFYEDVDLTEYDLSKINVGDIIIDNDAPMVGICVENDEYGFGCNVQWCDIASDNFRYISEDKEYWTSITQQQVGTKLYKHTLTFDDGSNREITFISTDNTPLEAIDEDIFNTDNPRRFNWVQYDVSQQDEYLPILAMWNIGTDINCSFITSDGQLDVQTFTSEDFSIDTVTPL